MYAFIVVTFWIVNPCQLGKAVLFLDDLFMILVNIRSQFFKGKSVAIMSKYHTPKGMWLVIPTGVDISNQHSSQGWAYRWHCGSSAFRPDAISAPTTVPGNPSGSPRLRDT